MFERDAWLSTGTGQVQQIWQQLQSTIVLDTNIYNVDQKF